MLNLNNELQVALQAAQEAGRAILHERKHLLVSFKEHSRDLITSADIKANTIIEKHLQQHFADPIVSEENPQSHTLSLKQPRLWFIDPIDGTLAFSKGEDEFCTMIGLCFDGKVVLGLVYQPSTQNYWYAIKNQGAFFVCNGKSTTMHLKIDEHSPKNPRFLFSKSRISPSLLQSAAQLSSQVKQMSSAGLKIAFIAQGKADFYLMPYHQIMLWDLCAPTIILQEAQGIIEHLDHTPLRFDDSLAAPGWIYAAHPAWTNLAHNFIPTQP